MDKVYSLMDRKLGQYGQLLLARNDETMKRNVLDGVKGSGSMIEKYPHDFDLVSVGTFDSDTGKVEGTTPRLIGSVADILEATNG